MTISFYRYNENGFTVIEVIAVLIIIGIVAAITVGGLSSQAELTSQADIVKSHLRFAQLKALQDDTASWGIAFTASSYSLYSNEAPATINFPGENSGSHSFPSVVTVTNPSTIKFDQWGSPGNENVLLTLRQGADTKTIIITADTGYIAP